MIPKISLIPRITTSRKKFIGYIIDVCECHDVLEEKKNEWVERITKELYIAHYFEGMIFVSHVNPYLLHHELIHHISRVLKYLTQSKKWVKLDYLNDDLDIAIFGKK